MICMVDGFLRINFITRGGTLGNGTSGRNPSPAIPMFVKVLKNTEKISMRVSGCSFSLFLKYFISSVCHTVLDPRTPLTVDGVTYCDGLKCQQLVKVSDTSIISANITFSYFLSSDFLTVRS